MKTCVQMFTLYTQTREKRKSSMTKIKENYSREVQLTLHAATSLGNAVKSKSNLPQVLTELTTINGFSGRKFRLFMNNIASKKDLNYLEVGVFCGSTIVSALFNNIDKIGAVYAIDNWSEFKDYVDPKETFYSNINKWLPDHDKKLNIMEGDCFSIDKSQIDQKINLYFYDGPHTEEDHRNAFLYYDDVFDDVFIAIVDDWIRERVRIGTKSAFEELNYKIVAEWIVEPDNFDGLKGADQPDLDWWNGVYIAIIKKK